MSYSRLHWADVERSLFKLTTKKVKLFKPKHVQIVTAATHQRDIPVTEMMRTLFGRIREGHWAVIIVIQILMRDGDSERVFGALKSQMNLLGLDGFRDRSASPQGVLQAKNIKTFGLYLQEKVNVYNQSGKDYLSAKRETVSKFKSANADADFLKEVDLIQGQSEALLQCSFIRDDMDNVISLQAFRLIISDLMGLFHLINEAILKILESYFELPKELATRSLEIYKKFAQQTPKTTSFFDIARSLRYELGLTIPEFKFPSTSLSKALEDYLNAPDFETQRRLFKAKKEGKTTLQPANDVSNQQLSYSTSPKRLSVTPNPPNNDLVDFFSSIDHEIRSYQNVAAQQNQAYQDAVMQSNPFAVPIGANYQNPYVNNVISTNQNGVLMNGQMSNAMSPQFVSQVPSNFNGPLQNGFSQQNPNFSNNQFATENRNTGHFDPKFGQAYHQNSQPVHTNYQNGNDNQAFPGSFANGPISMRTSTNFNKFPVLKVDPFMTTSEFNDHSRTQTYFSQQQTQNTIMQQNPFAQLDSLTFQNSGHVELNPYGQQQILKAPTSAPLISQMKTNPALSLSSATYSQQQPFSSNFMITSAPALQQTQLQTNPFSVGLSQQHMQPQQFEFRNQQAVSNPPQQNSKFNPFMA